MLKLMSVVVVVLVSSEVTWRLCRNRSWWPKEWPTGRGYYIHPKWGECCGRSATSMPKVFSELAAYNTRVHHQGLVHTRAYHERMEVLQQEFYEWHRETHGNPMPDQVSQSESQLYRVQTAVPDRAGRWQIEAFVADRDEADRMVEAFVAQGERANVTTIDLSDPLERDSVCHNLTAFFQSLKASRRVQA